MTYLRSPRSIIWRRNWSKRNSRRDHMEILLGISGLSRYIAILRQVRPSRQARIRRGRRRIRPSSVPTVSPTSPTQAPPVAPVLVERVRSFLEACEIDRNLSPLTIRQYDHYLNYLLGWLRREQPGLDRDHINLKTREFGVIGKGRKPRVVFLSDAATEALARYLETRQDRWKPLFIRMKGKPDLTPGGPGMRMSSRSIERIVGKYVRIAGLGVKATPHTLRHSFATDLLSNGADLRAVQELLFFNDPATTEIYTHVTNPQLRAAHRKFHSGNRE